MHTPLATKLTELTALKAEINGLLPGPLEMWGNLITHFDEDCGGGIGIHVCKLGSRDLEVEAIRAVALSGAKVAVYGLGGHACLSVIFDGVRCNFNCEAVTADEARAIIDAARADKVAA